MPNRVGRCLIVVALIQAAAFARAQEPSTCGLHGADATSPSAACLSCHGAGTLGHPVDLDYRASRARRPAMLRTAEEVVQRGVRIPDGQLRCATCHDGGSPWAHYVAIPPGTSAVTSVDPHGPSDDDFEPGEARPGDEVSPKPLCLACHRLD